MKKKMRFAAALLCLVVLLLPFSGIPVPATAEENFPADLTISTPEDLLNFSFRVSRESMDGLTVVLQNDIDMMGEDWTPIGQIDAPFSGTFDGGGHTVKNLTLGMMVSDYAGLFGALDHAAVKNIHLKSCDFQGINDGFHVIGAVAGYSGNSVIENCIAEDTTVGGIDGNIGGIVGAAEGGSITGCHTQTELWGSALVGGIMGAGSASISGCSADVEITCVVAGEKGGMGFGGIAGHSDARIEDCFSTGSVSAQGSIDGIAGIVGYTLGTVDHCYSTAMVTRSGDPSNSQFTAGLAGYLGADWDNTASLKNSVAINPTVSVQNEADCVTLGRVASFCEGQGAYQLQNNYAWSGMKIGVLQKEAVTEPGTSQQSIHGGDVTAKTLGTMDFWKGLGFDFTNGPWKWEAGKLPYLEGSSASAWPRWLSSGEEPVRPEPTPVPSSTPAPTASPMPTAAPTPGKDGKLYLSTAEELKIFAANWGQYSAAGVAEVYLTDDIDMKGEAMPGAAIRNIVFDGQDHTVSNLGSGLFSSLSGCTVQNVRLENLSVSDGAGRLGGIAGSATVCTFDNCHVTGAVTAASGTSCYAGGILGSADMKVSLRRCSSEIVMVNQIDSGYVRFGGIVGWGGSDSLIENCYTGGSITNDSDSDFNAGGLAGAAVSAKNSYSTMALSSHSKSGINHIGGLVGSKSQEIIIENCAALNPSLLYENGVFVSRILAGYTQYPDNYTATDYLRNNYGWAGMQLKTPCTAAYDGNNAHDTLNGQNIYTKEIADRSFWETQVGFSFEEDLWQWEEGKLPCLKGGISSEWPDWLGDYMIGLENPYLTVEKGTAYGEIALPQTVTARLGSGEDIEIPVAWYPCGSYDGGTNGRYTTSGKLILPDGVENPWDLQTSFTITVTDQFTVSYVTAERIYAPVGTAFADLDLPKTVKVNMSGVEKVVEISVEWNSDEYDPDLNSSQTLRGTLVNLPENITNPNQRTAPLLVQRTPISTPRPTVTPTPTPTPTPKPTATPVPTPSPTPVPGPYTISAAYYVSTSTKVGTPVEDLVLPKEVHVRRNDGQTVSLPVTWTDFSHYVPDVCGSYSIYGEYTKYPEDLTNPDNIKPYLSLMVLENFRIENAQGIRLEVKQGIAFEDLPLPDEAPARRTGGSVVMVPVKWNPPDGKQSKYDPNKPGRYVIRGVYHDLPDDLTNPMNRMPLALVTVVETAVTPTPPPDISGGSGGGGTPADPMVETVTAETGSTVTITTQPEGDKTIEVKTPSGEAVASIKLPAEPGAGKKFADVKSSEWYADEVDKATGYGLFNGTSDTTFSPNTGMNRGMVAQVLYNLSGQTKYGLDTGTFTDVKSGQWYQNAVDWASKAGVVNGVSDTSFAPDSSVTREQLVTMLYRYAKAIGADTKTMTELTSFPDASKVSSYAQDAMKWAVANGFIGGRASGGKDYIAPGGTATRAEVAAILTRFVEFMKK